jgi:CheY-like chemotaxis protein
MTQLLLIADADTLDGLGSMLRNAGYEVEVAPSGQRALDVLEHRHVNLVVSESFLRDLRAALQTAPHDAAATRAESRGEPPAAVEEAHAAARWARALAPVIASAKDPRTVSGWSRLVFVSPGALRNWCRTAGVSARRSLVFARLLRVAFLSQGGRHRPEDLLDVVDRRTFLGLLKFAGLDPERPFPENPEAFLQQQMLVQDPDRLFEIRRALAESQRPARAPSRLED